MNLLMTTWIYVTVVARSCHTLNIQPRNQSKELEVTGKPPCREVVVKPKQFWFGFGFSVLAFFIFGFLLFG